jgi:hypothetical protein
MILDCVLTACNEKSLYIDFIPYFIKSWNKLYPNVDIKIILILKKIPENLIQYKNNIILFEPLKNISTVFISQYIRLLYPAILNYDNGIMITDIDMIPMNTFYFTQNIEKYDNNKFISFRDNLLNREEISICYNTAIPKIWSDIFKIKSIQDIKNKLINKFNTIKYDENNKKFGWIIDQKDFYKYIMQWENKETDLIILNDKNTGYNRLSRRLFKLTDKVIENIKNEKYTDYHCYRPFNNYKYLNNKIYDSLSK